MKIKIADPNPKVLSIEIILGLLLSYIGNSTGSDLIGGAIGTIGLLFFLIGVGNLIYFLYKKVRKDKLT